MTRFEDKLKLLAPAPASDALRARIAAPGRSRVLRIVPMAAAAAGLLAALGVVILKGPTGTPSARNEAEREFRKIERALLEAKSLRVSFSRSAELKDPKGGVEKVESSGVLLLKEGSRMNFSFSETRGNTGRVDWRYLCDGRHSSTKMTLTQGKQSVTNRVIPVEDLNEKLALALARESLAVPAAVFQLGLGDLKSRLEVSEFSKVVDAVGRPVLRYRVGAFEATLIYDPKTLVPLKRVLTNKEVGTITETYDKIEINPDLGEEQFRIAPDAEEREK